MKCNDIDQLQHAWADNELDAANSHAFAAHLASCPACTKKIDELTALKRAIKTEATRYEAPPELYAKLPRMKSASSSSKWQPLKWGTTGAGLALAACLAFLMIVNPAQQNLIEEQLIASHIRSLQDGHLTDVLSTDQHTVKPWFNGRLDISPPVTDLATSGFPLFGGRLDYIDHHAVAVIVYKHNAHIINLFVWPSNVPPLRLNAARQQGYNIRKWHDSDLEFWAVSDVNPAKLEEFENLYRGQTIIK